MKMEEIKEIANAVLYEGYLLYPYRYSAIKNRQRWMFGVVYPREYSEANGGIEPWTMRTECLVIGSADTSIDVRARFLHLLVRTVMQPESPGAPSQASGEEANASEWSLASRFANEPWEEGVEREVNALDLSLRELVAHPLLVQIEFRGGYVEEGPTVTSIATIAREQQPLAGTVVIAAEPVGTDLFKLSVHIENRTPGTGGLIGNAVMLHSFVSTHTILQVRRGTFISLIDPPEALKAIAQECQNLHTWPVLVGNQGECDAILSSPIILYDYPQIAPESPGSLFDGTEIDELLTLRIMTLTDEEKQEIRQGDERVREILERTEALSPEQFMKLHGVIRSLRPVEEEGNMSSTDRDVPGEDYAPPESVLIAGREVKAGDRVRLHPKARADAFDMLLDGKTARIESIQQDFENRIYLVVTLDDDPGREQWDERILPGHRFYFFTEEVEPLGVLDTSWRKP